MLNQNNTTMSLIRFNPSYNELLPTFDGIFNQFLDNTLKEEDRFVPNVDIIENDKNFELHVAVPGVKKEDFNVEISDNLSRGVMLISVFSSFIVTENEMSSPSAFCDFKITKVSKEI